MNPVTYSLGNYDFYGKGRYSKSVGDQNAGREKIIYLGNDRSKEEEEELDDFVDTVNSSSKAKIKKKIVTGEPMGATDFYAIKNKDRAAGQLKNTGGININEYAENHKNHAMKGMVPNFTYRSKNNLNPSSRERHAVGSYIRNKPGSLSGTQYGTSRPHKNLSDVEDENIFSVEDMLDPLERSFKRQQNKIKKVLSTIKEYVSNKNRTRI